MSVRRLLPLPLLVLALAGCGDEASTTSPATVTIGFDVDGDGNAPATTAKLECPGDASDPAACAQLADLPPEAFEPTPQNRPCTEIYGGPQTGWIRGTVNGREIDASYSRHDGCAIDRFDLVAPVLRLAAGDRLPTPDLG